VTEFPAPTAVSVIIFLINSVVSMRSPKTALHDPWEANTLEWYTTSSPPVHNFDSVPEVQSARPLRELRRAQRAAAWE
jgi:cytochrome c oxidase subunit I